MGKYLGIIAAGIGLFVLHLVWWLAVGIGAVVWFWMMPAAANLKIIQVIDLETGSITTQPQDKHSEKYLASRDDS
jgi:hypothetical protein